MTEEPKLIQDPSNGLSDSVFWRTLVISFVCISIGVADPLLNALIHAMQLQHLDWLSRLVLNVTGPLDMVQRLRVDDFWLFSLSAAIVSVIFAFGLGTMTFAMAYLFNAPEKQKSELDD